MADSFFGPAYIDIDEWRDAPQRHRYVHGGFKETDTRFSFYFPPKENYEGRMLHFLEGGLGGHEVTVLGPVGFGAFELTFNSGAYLVESNQGHFGLDYSGLNGDPSILHWRASAESARYSKELAKEMYGEEPHHSYAWGGSGGALRSVHAIERAGDVYDGCVPFMHGHHFLMSNFPVAMNALRLIGSEKLNVIIDATEVGGSGNPFEGLDTEQREALAELYRCGLARGGERQLGYPGAIDAVLCWLQSEMTWADPEYFEDFWTKTGYMGKDDPNLAKQVQEITTTVRQVLTNQDLVAMGGAAAATASYYSSEENPIAITVNDGDVSGMRGGTMILKSGKGAGRELAVSTVLDDVLIAVTGPYGYPEMFNGVEPGDEVVVTNRKFLAQCFWSRHHLEGELDYRPNHTWAVDGQQIYPQRPHHAFMNMGPDYLYKFDGKMILVQNTIDIGCWPAGGTEYHEYTRRHFGDRLDDHFRLWWNDNARHGPPQGLEGITPHYSTWLIDYNGSVHQAVLDLIDWVENGKEPPANTSYEYSPDGKLTLAATASERGGIQPVVNATVNGGVRADVKVGEKVNFEASADVPRGTGRITAAEWDFEGKGTWELKEKDIDGRADSIKLKATHTFDTPGTYFPVVRVTAQRDGDAKANFSSLPNLGRVRVVVS